MKQYMITIVPVQALKRLIAGERLLVCTTTERGTMVIMGLQAYFRTRERQVMGKKAKHRQREKLTSCTIFLMFKGLWALSNDFSDP